MRTVFVCAALFLQLIWLSLSNGQAATTPGPDCSSLQDQDECCSSHIPCVYVNCTVNNITVAGCYNSTGDAGCANADEAVNICPAPASNGTTSATASSASAPGGKETGTTQASATSTSAPVEKETVNCTSLSSDQSLCCSAGNSSACIFFNCSGSDVTLSTTVCAPADAPPVCTEAGDKPSGNMCNETTPTTPTSGENPTQSPSSKESGGQQFDAASFIGGIVLCAGVIAISYFGLKFYRSRQEKNYRSM